MVISFLQHVRRIVERICEPYGVRVYDEREKTLAWLVQEALDEGLNAALVIGVPTLNRAQGEPICSHLHELTCTIALRSSAVMGRADSYALAEKIYTGLHGSIWVEPTCEIPESELQPNVGADNLRSTDSPESADILHTMTISAEVNLENI